MTKRVFPPYSHDDDLILGARADGAPRVNVYRLLEPVVVLGSGSRPEVELHEDVCRSEGIPILRRRGGGCAVVIDPGNMIVSTVLTGVPFGHPHEHFRALSEWLVAGLAAAGIGGIHREAVCDLALGNEKIGGACLYRAKDLLYYSATLLVDPDLARVERCLSHPPREPDYRAGRSHADFMGSLATGEDIDGLVASLRDVLKPPEISDPKRSRSL